jgi:hypothetical protein
MQKLGRRQLLLGVALLSLPSFIYVCVNRDDPHFGILEDDGIYLIGAKSIAEGSGYRVENLSGEPYQTKYPPLYPLYLSIAWRAAATLPARITAALMLSWLAFPVCVALVHVWLRRRGFPPRAAWIVTGLFALNPYILFFNANLGSEMMFVALALSTILLAERDRALAAGIVGGIGTLARSAGIALLPAGIVYYLWKRQPRNALWFTLGVLPPFIGWMLWSRTHQAPGSDIITMCYTNYLGFLFQNVGWDNLGMVLWRNFSALLESFGSYVFPQMIGGLPAKMILQPLALAMILGTIRMGRDSLYAVFGLFSSAMLLIWDFAPNQRFVLPLAPLLLAGFYTEASHFAGLVRKAFAHKDRSQRVVAYGFAGFLIAILATGAGLQVYMWVNVIPGQARDDRANAKHFASLYEWIRINTSPDAAVIWENATALYLFANRHSAAFLIPPRQWYKAEHDDDLAFYRRIDEYAGQNYEFVMFPAVGPHRNEEILKAATENANLERIHEDTGGIIYKVQKKAGR